MVTERDNCSPDEEAAQVFESSKYTTINYVCLKKSFFNITFINQE